MDNLNLCIITKSEYIKKLVKYSIEDIEASINIHDGIFQVEKTNHEFFIIIIEEFLINQQFKNFLLNLGNRFVITVCDITRVSDVKKLFDEGTADFFIMEPIRSELMEIAIKTAIRYFKWLQELKSKSDQITELKRQKEQLERDIKKLIPSSDLKRNISSEIYKKVGTDRETLSRAYDIKDEEESQ